MVMETGPRSEFESTSTLSKGMRAVKVEFAILPGELEPYVPGLALGHISITVNKTTVSSRDRNPPQSMMMILSITDLLESLKLALSTAHGPGFIFTGTDSSFNIVFSRMSNGKLRLSVKGQIVGDVTNRELAKALLDGVQRFIREYEIELPAPGQASDTPTTETAIMAEFADALSEFVPIANAAVL